jgi:acetylornithine/N-succinyldiaminopimelate aminotransferase
LASIGTELGVFSEVRGRGLMLGAVLADSYRGKAGDVLDVAAAHGLLLLQAGPDVLRFVPPLNVSDEDLSDGLSRLRDALRAFVKQ